MPRTSSESNKGLPERNGKTWKSDEEGTVLRFIHENKSVEFIATSLKRTHGSIRAKLRDLACRFVYEGKTLEEASKLTSVLIGDIEYSLRLREIADNIREEKDKNSTVKTQLTFNEVSQLQSPIQRALDSVEKETNISILKEIRDLLKNIDKRLNILEKKEEVPLYLDEVNR